MRGTSRWLTDHAPDARGLGEVERRSGGGSPSSECIQRWPYSACAECAHCAGRRLKNKREPCCFPWMGFPPWWISAPKRGRLGKGVSRGGKPRRGIQQCRHRPTRLERSVCRRSHSARGERNGWRSSCREALSRNCDRRVVRGCDG